MPEMQVRDKPRVRRGVKKDRESPIVNLKTIADETGVTIATVSRILRGKVKGRPDTRRAVLAAAKRHGYRQNLLVKALQTGRSQAVGVMLDIGDQYFARVAVGIHNELIAHDHIPIILWAKTERRHAVERGNELEQIHRLVDRRVDAVILCARDDTVGADYVSEILQRNIPLVTVDRYLKDVAADFVGTDDEHGGRLAAEHLLGLGHRRFGVLTGPPEVRLAWERKHGFMAVLDRVADAVCTVYEEVTFRDGQPGAEALLAATPRPTAIFATNDLMVPDIYRAAARKGLVIPRDLSVVGFADLFDPDWMSPGLTTVHQEPENLGRLAAAMTLEHLYDAAPAGEAPRVVRLKPELVVRHSTAAPHG